jgi:pyrroline-5-carboxylate reductase
MGGALLAGWLAKQIGGPFVAVEPNHAAVATFAGKPGVTLVERPEQIPAGFAPDVVLVALKPQTTDANLPAYRRFAPALFVSIAAGKTLAAFARLLGPEAAVVRTIPNTPAQLGRGITVACANGQVTAAQRARAQALLEAVGEVGWVEDEGLIDVATAVSGSGPAYVFLLAECLAAAGAAQGLPPELAARLARVTVAGSGELLHRSAETPEALRAAVTSPAGTTAAALAILMADEGLRAMLTRAVAAATKRSRELASA